MLAPGFSLVGLTGIVWMRSPGAPSGCVTVMVDWLSHGYTPENGHPVGSLPECVNVPAAHLSVLDELTVEQPAPEKPRLEKMESEAKKSGANEESPVSDKPKLRLL